MEDAILILNLSWWSSKLILVSDVSWSPDVYSNLHGNALPNSIYVFSHVDKIDKEIWFQRKLTVIENTGGHWNQLRQAPKW